jgi:hypothetical protein
MAGRRPAETSEDEPPAKKRPQVLDMGVLQERVRALGRGSGMQTLRQPDDRSEGKSERPGRGAGRVDIAARDTRK